MQIIFARWRCRQVRAKRLMKKYKILPLCFIIVLWLHPSENLQTETSRFNKNGQARLLPYHAATG